MEIRHAILSILAEGPRHGYAVHAALRARIGRLWPVNHGQIYATLGRLARAGLIATATAAEAAAGSPAAAAARAARESGATRARRFWKILPAGSMRHADWLRRPWPAGEERDELLAKLALLVQRGDGAAIDRLLSGQAQRYAALAATLRASPRRRPAGTLEAARGPAPGASRAAPAGATRGPSRGDQRGSPDGAAGLVQDALTALLDAEIEWLERARATLAACGSKSTPDFAPLGGTQR